MSAQQRDADVIVAGAGPAGAAAAARLAAAGVDVLLLERGRFPRDKVCGDFVGPVALAELEALGVAEMPAVASANAVDRAALFADGRELITYVLPKVAGLPGYGRVIPRVVLDDAIAEVARKAGARVEEGRAVCGFRAYEDRVEVAVREGAGECRLRALVLVGADGAGSIVARAVRGGAPQRDEFLVAVRAYYEGVAGPAGRCDLSFTTDSFPGYAWIFPTAEGVANVGVGMVVETFPAAKEQLRDLLERLVRHDRAMRSRLHDGRMLGEPVGWPLSTYSGRTPPAADRVVLVGDAAGLVNPMNGEGIQAALCSARWAAETIVAALRSGDVAGAALGAYATRLRRELALDMLLARLVVRAIANRALNPLWLPMLRGLVARARVDARYADATGAVLAGVVPVQEAFATPVLLRSAGAIAAELAGAAGGALRGGPAAVLDACARACAPAVAMLAEPRAALRWAEELAQAARDVAASRSA
jgi:menaquinone-9 beta-reductase